MIIIPNSTAGISSSTLTSGVINSTKAAGVSSKETQGAEESSSVSTAQSQTKQYDTILNDISDAISFSQTQSGYLSVAGKAFHRMEELALAAQDDALSLEEREELDREFNELREQVKEIATKKFNDTALFSDSSLEVVVDTAGTKVRLEGINLVSGNVYGSVLSENVSLADSSTAAKLRSALNQVDADQQNLAEAQSWLANSSDAVMNGRETLGLASSRYSDEGSAAVEAEYARRQILYNSNSSISAQANAIPDNVFELLQGVIA